MQQSFDEAERRRLGLDTPITRRDFLNGSLAGAAGLSSAATAAPADPFTGYGGVGDYARANGDTWPVVQAAHRMRDGAYARERLAGACDSGHFDLIVVGAGLAGLSAALRFRQLRGRPARVLILENHPMPGGEAKQNEFEVDGIRLLGPQGSNDFAPPGRRADSITDQFFEAFGLPLEFDWQPWSPALKPLRFARDNYTNMDGMQERHVDVGYFFDRAQGADGPTWQRNIWDNDLKETPFGDTAKRDLLRWRATHGRMDDAEERYLDTLTYRDYLENIRGYDPAVTRLAEPIVALLAGVSTDAACARLGRQLVQDADRPMAWSFPGGNSPFARALLRALLPEALPGKDFESLMYGRVQFHTLEVRDQAVQLRLNATVLNVQHGVEQRHVEVIYERGGQLYRASAGGVVLASGGWVNKHLLADMPNDLQHAYAQFGHAPALIVNVALRQWRFLYDLDVTACRWFDEDGFGYCCNLRQNMITAQHAPPLHPDKPAVLTFYLGLPVPGLPALAQGMAARARLMNTPYADFERRIRAQMVRLFARTGFSPARDIAAIVLNRWGHARLIEPPGFHYGTAGNPSPLERVRQGYGRIAIGHSELNGAQHWGSALDYGRKAADQVAAIA